MGTCLKSGTPDLAPALSDTGQMKCNISDEWKMRGTYNLASIGKDSLGEIEQEYQDALVKAQQLFHAPYH
jgi:hypothetical protein